jgi:hypothetical protein
MSNAVAIGLSAGSTSQGNWTVAVGDAAGNTNQGNYATAVGHQAGMTSQWQNAVALGSVAGQTNQGNLSIAIGTFAGQTRQGDQSVAVGYAAGITGQGIGSVAVGANTIAANYSIAIGTSSVAEKYGSIVLNATGLEISSSAYNAFYVAPIRNVPGSGATLQYNTLTCEISFQSSTQKIKKNIQNLTANTAHVYDLIPREYDLIYENDAHAIGLVAEEAAAADPNFAWNDVDGSPGGINWFNVVLYAISEMKKSRDETKELRADIRDSQNAIRELSDRITVLEQN